MTRLGSGVFSVQREGRQAHEVTWSFGEGWRCDCEGWKYRKKCLHVAEVILRTKGVSDGK